MKCSARYATESQARLGNCMVNYDHGINLDIVKIIKYVSIRTDGSPHTFSESIHHIECKLAVTP
jgi:hypothetical protein